MTKLKTILALTAMAILVTACGKDDAPKPAAAASTAAPAAKEVKKFNDPKGDPAVALQSYKEIRTDEDLLALTARAGGVPSDVSKIVGGYVDSYTQADAFKKKDLEAKFSADVAELAKKTEKDGAYFWIDLTELQGLGTAFVGSYNFEKKGFLIDSLYHPSSGSPEAKKLGMRSYRLHDEGVIIPFRGGLHIVLNNWSNFQFLSVTDEAAARLLEAEREKTNPMKAYRDRESPSLFLRIYAYAGAASADKPGVRAQIMKVAVVDKKGNIVAQM